MQSNQKRNLSKHIDPCLIIMSYLQYTDIIKMQGINRRFLNTIVPKAVTDMNYKTTLDGIF